jgi:hypothetical protein
MPEDDHDEFLRERRVDRQRRRSSSEPSDRKQKHPRHERERRSRRIAVVVLVLVAVAIAVTGVEAKRPVFGGAGSDSVPFNLVPITGGPTTSASESSTTVTSTVGTGVPEADGGFGGDVAYSLR